MRGVALATAVFALALVSVHVVNTPWSLVRLEEIAGTRAIPDAEFHYTSAALYGLLDALGAAGRSFYLYRLLGGFDVIFPTISAIWGGLAIAFAFRGREGAASRVRWLTFVPAVAALCDYGENAAVTSLLLTYPTPHPSIAALAGWLTTLKVLSSATVLMIVVVGLTRRVFRTNAPAAAPTRES